MTISVIMVTYHTGSVLPVAVASVLNQEGLAELILVDNGNPPDVIAHFRQMALVDLRIKIISGHGNIGFARACNLGAKSALGEYLVLLNPDCILPPEALKNLTSEMSRLPNTVLAGPLLLNSDGSEQSACRRPLLTPRSALMSAISEIAGFLSFRKKKRNFPDELHDVAALSGACMCIKKADYEELGGFDEGYFLHVEDMDLCFRIAKAGKRIVCVPSVRVAHLRATSSKTSNGELELHKAQGFIRYFNVNFANEFPGLIFFIRICIWIRYFLRRIFASGFLKLLFSSGKKAKKSSSAASKLHIISASLISTKNASELAGKTVLVTGATSQVGLYVVRHLLASGAAVLAVSRRETPPFYHPYLKWIKGDITNQNFSLQGFLADIAIHCAPLWKLPAIMSLLAASEVRKIVAISSTSVFTKALSANRNEQRVVSSLINAEQELSSSSLRHKISWTILRPTLIYGAGLDNNVTLLARLIKSFSLMVIYPPGLGRRQPVHAEDVALAALRAASSEVASGMSYNISGGEILTYRAMIERIFAALDRPVRIFETSLLPTLLGFAGAILRLRNIHSEIAYSMNEDMIFFHDDAARDLGYKPRGFLSGGIEDFGNLFEK